MKITILFLCFCFLFGCNNGSPTDSTIPSLIGDINKDGIVDQIDIDLLGDAFGSHIGTENWNPDADLDGNGKVDGYDLILLSVNQTIDKEF